MAEPDLAAALDQAAANDAFLAELQDILRQADQAADAQGFHCRACGECCRFEQFGHKLYLTAGELALMLRDGRAAGGTVEPGLCPHQRGDRCAARTGRALGCRLFFCDPAAQQWFCDAYERFHQRIKHLHEKHGVGYAYADLIFFLIDTDRRGT